MATPRVTHVPAQTRQRRHTSTSTHGSTGKTRALARCPNPHPRSRYLQDPATYARPRSPGPSAVSHSPLLRLRLYNLHHHDHLIHHHRHVLIQHSTPWAARDTSQTGPQNPSPPRATPPPPRAHAPTRPAPATQPKPKTAAKQPPEPISAPRPQPAAKPEPKPKPGATTAARARPPEDVLYDIRPQPSQAWGQQHPARRPPTVTDAAATTFIAERATTEARRTSSRHLSKPAPQAHGPPLTRPERHQGPPAASPPPYQPSMTAHIQRMPRYRRCRESPPNPEAETVRAHPRVHIRAGPHSSRTPTEQDYEESPWPATATGPHGPVTPTHAHSYAQDRGPAQGQWWQRWIHTQLSELQSGPREGPPSRAWSGGPARGWWRAAASGRRGGGCRRPHGKPCWPMRSTPWESTPATSPRPRTIRMSSGACRGNPPGDTARRHPPVGHHPKPSPTHTHPLTTPQASAHRHWRHPQHPRSPAHHTTRRA